jgi:hypothetical protein
MPPGSVATAYQHLQVAVDELRAAAESAIVSDDELLSVLTLSEGMTRQLDHLTVSAVATLQRRGTFSERGYRKPAAALTDLLGWEWFEARRRVTAAEQVCERIGLDGTVLAARLPATAKAFAAGQAGLRHVEVIATLLAGPAAGRLTGDQRSGVDEQLAALTGTYTPTQLRAFGADLIDKLDQDGPEPDDTPTPAVNELTLTRSATGPAAPSRADSRTPPCTTRSPPCSTPRPNPSTRTTNAEPGNATPKPSPTSAATSSTTATYPNAAAAAPTSTSSSGSTTSRTGHDRQCSTSAAS